MRLDLAAVQSSRFEGDASYKEIYRTGTNSDADELITVSEDNKKCNDESVKILRG